MLQILADDMGQWAAYKDQNPEIIHPTLDKLIAEGTSFENSACNTPVCSASRATWFTGRLPSQHNVHDWISRGNGCPGDAPGLNYSQGEVFTTDILTSLGYTAGISGKVHLGNQPVPKSTTPLPHTALTVPHSSKKNSMSSVRAGFCQWPEYPGLQLELKSYTQR